MCQTPVPCLPNAPRKLSFAKVGLGAGGIIIGSFGGAALGGWGTTNEGKVIAYALLDSFNNLVPQVQILLQKELPAPIPTKKR